MMAEESTAVVILGGTGDLALRKLARSLYRDRSIAAQVREIHSQALRYAASAWHIDRQRDDMPPRYQGTNKEYRWRAFRSGAAMPISERQLRNIVGC